MASEDLRQYSMAELRAMRNRGETHTRKDAPIYELDEEFWQNARVVIPEKQPKTHMGLRVDKDVLKWFREKAGKL